MADIPVGKIVPKDFDFSRTMADLHGHTPSEFGEIVFNNVAWANRLNALIREINRTVDLRFNGQGTVGTDHIPYIATPANPTIGWNRHGHTSPYDGGKLIGAGMHDHRDNREGGFAYSVYHPGTSLPSHAYEREEVY